MAAYTCSLLILSLAPLEQTHTHTHIPTTNYNAPYTSPVRQVRQTASLCIFDEVDAALDTQRAQALARYVASREGSQAVFVSHRPPMIEVANRLVGVYSSGNGSHSVCISL